MSPSAPNSDREPISGRRHRTAAQADLANIELRAHVESEGAVNARTLKEPILDHSRSTEAPFFSRLEHEFDCAADRFAPLRQETGDGEKDRGVSVVAARVHDTGDLRRVRRRAHFLDR